MARDPKFKSYFEESDHWDTVPMEELIANSEPVDVKFVDRRPKKAISLRLTENLIDHGKAAAAELGMGYQTLFRMWIVEGLRRHRLQRLEEASSRKRRSA